MEKVSRIKYWLLCLIPFVLCTYAYWVGIVVVAYLLCWLIEGGLKSKLQTIRNNRFVLLFAGFYALYFMGMIYTSNYNVGWFNLQVKLSLLLFPLLLSAEGKMDVEKQKPIMYSFIAGCVVNGISCLIYATWKYVNLDVFEFQYRKFSALIHPSYFSMYIDLALLFLYYLFTIEKISLRKIERVVLLIFAFFLEFILVLLQSKMGMIVSGGLLLVLIIRYGIRHNYKTAGMLFASAAVIYFITFHFVIGDHSRVVGAVNAIENKQVTATTVESTQARSIVWRAAVKVIERHPVIGVGTGDADTVLVKQYVDDGYTGVASEHLNTHNQYLQTTVVLGLVGLLYLLACLLFPFIRCVKEQRFIYAAFLVIIAANFLVESMLEPQSGTIFYGFFNSLLMFNFVI